jgi:uncharacterized protein HemX
MRLPKPRSISVLAKEKTGKENKKGLLKAFVLILVLLLAGGYLWHKHQNQKNNTFVVTSASQLEKNNTNYTSNILKSKDLTSYQRVQTDQAGLYIDNNQLSEAERVMNEVFSRVPSDKIISDTYGTMVTLEKAKNDTAQYKHYLRLYISQLRNEGNTTTADQMQTVLDSTK